MNKKHAGAPRTISVSDLLEAGQVILELEIVAGANGLKRRILEPTVNRPGLALSGFYSYFAHRRVQVMGLAEYAYLSSLEDDVRLDRLREFFSKSVPCVVVARGKRVFSEMVELADEYDVPLFRSHVVTKRFINTATIVMENLMAPRMTVQGTMVEIMGIGVLVRGKPGVGKSEAALALVRRGFALVADDVTRLRLESSGYVVGEASEVTRYHMEIRGLGIIHVPSLFGVASVRNEKKLDLIVSLCDASTYDPGDRSGQTKKSCDIMGVEIPEIFVPVAPGREVANLVEVAALDFKLRRLGHDAEKELDAKLIARLSGGTGSSE